MNFIKETRKEEVDDKGNVYEISKILTGSQKLIRQGRKSEKTQKQKVKIFKNNCIKVRVTNKKTGSDDETTTQTVSVRNKENIIKNKNRKGKTK